MIQKVSFRNFKAYRSLELELEHFTVLVGPNASGKTTLLNGLHFVSRAAEYIHADRTGHMEQDQALHSHGVNSPVEFMVSGVWEGTVGLVRLRGVTYNVPTGNRGVEEKLRFEVFGEWGGQDFPLQTEIRGGGPEAAEARFKPSLSVLRNAMGATAVLRFEPRKLMDASYSVEENPALQSDGGGLASVLAHLKLSHDEVFDEIESALRQIVPAVRRIRLERVLVTQTQSSRPTSPGSSVWGNRIVLDMQGAKGVPADAAGEGTLMALGLLAVVKGTTKPRLVLLDDIELGLHPTAQGKLIEVLRKIQEHDPELQIVARSHSPFILNYLDPKEVRMTFLAENGFARCEKLTAHPEFERWKDLMSPGEFWSTVGESWVGKASEPTTHE